MSDATKNNLNVSFKLGNLIVVTCGVDSLLSHKIHVRFNNNNNNNNSNIFMQDCCFSFKKKNCYQCRSCKKFKKIYKNKNKKDLKYR